MYGTVVDHGMLYWQALLCLVATTALVVVNDGLSKDQTASQGCQLTTKPRYKMRLRQISWQINAVTLPILCGQGHGEVVSSVTGCRTI